MAKSSSAASSNGVAKAYQNIGVGENGVFWRESKEMAALEAAGEAENGKTMAANNDQWRH